jgi:hypothetical protein
MPTETENSGHEANGVYQSMTDEEKIQKALEILKDVPVPKLMPQIARWLQTINLHAEMKRIDAVATDKAKISL